jgi:hypothetical protein
MDGEGTVPFRVQAEEEAKGGPRKLSTSMAPGIRIPKEESVCLLSPRGTLEK